MCIDVRGKRKSVCDACVLGMYVCAMCVNISLCGYCVRACDFTFKCDMEGVSVEKRLMLVCMLV